MTDFILQENGDELLQEDGGLISRDPKTRQLTKRTYLGVGYLHLFQNNTTNEFIYVPCTDAEYASLSGVGGAANNPTLGGHTWRASFGGTIKVDTPDSTLGIDEYCDYEDGYFVNTQNSHGGFFSEKVPLDRVSDNKIIEDDLI